LPFENGPGLLSEIRAAIINGNSASIVALINNALKEGIAPKEVFDTLASGVITMGEKLSNKEAFLPELVVSFETFKIGASIVEPKLKTTSFNEIKRKIVIGTVEGDIHNIGKNLVKTMFEVSGFEVHDVGVDVPPQKFVDKAFEIDADIIGCSTLVSPGLIALRKTVELVRRMRGENTKIIIGGYTTSQALANELGVTYCKDAYDAILKVNSLIKK